MTAALRRHGWSYLFVLPTFSLFVVFTLLPVAQGLVLSLQDARVTGGSFIGLANFATLADDPVFGQALGNTVLYATVVVAAQVTLALIVASLIQPLGAKSRIFYRALFYLPLVNSAILVAMVWRWIFNPNPFGLANAA
ncbi:MAG: sugar ABC transporter permease, partial [Chloroflexi bacterium]